MNFRHLRIFLTVCEVGNMTQAAKKMYMAQPTVSQAIAELEKYYDVRLFDRLNHKLYLTAAGERLQTYAHHILNISEQARKELADLNQAGLVRIGASLTVGTYLLPDLVVDFRQQSPMVEIFTLVDNTTVIEQKILEDQLDLGIVEGPVTSQHIVEEMYSNDHLVFIASPSHLLANKENITFRELANQPFIVREAGSGTQTIFEHAMQASEVPWKVAGIYNNIEAIKQAVIANLGLAVVSKIAVTNEVNQGKLVALPVQGISLKRKFNLIYHRQKFFTKAMQAFWDTSLEALKSNLNWEDETFPR
jgi:LysR family transcriptional regulator, transcriptional activator of the cysJI operon